MSVEKVGESALSVVPSGSGNSQRVKPKKRVLDEDAYTEKLEKIIVRDFYPDLPKLQAQAEYLDALRRNDVEKLRELHVKYGPKRGSKATPSVYVTPATFETPDPQATETPGDSQKKQKTASSQDSTEEGSSLNPESETQPDPDGIPGSLSLDQFLARNTSEDNASFEEIMVESEKRHRAKHAWLYKKVEESNKKREEQLALPSAEQQLAIEAASSGHATTVDTWGYTAKNAVMYVPEGVELSAQEKVENPGYCREVVHDNTRFIASPFNTEQSKQQLAEAAIDQAHMLQGKIGPDGKEILPQNTPKVNGYSFVATPSPAPGVEDSPMMTWGEIEGSPFRLDGGDTPRVATTDLGPIFKIPAVPKRDRIGMELAEKASKAHRTKKGEALKRVTANFASPSPKFGAASKSDRLLGLSPAAQLLASKKLGVRTNSDRALRASYTPSPTHLLPGDKTPLSLTPGSVKRTPSSTTPQGASSSRSTPKEDVASSLTDNLLNLPKRGKAQDYF